MNFTIISISFIIFSTENSTCVSQEGKNIFSSLWHKMKNIATKFKVCTKDKINVPFNKYQSNVNISHFSCEFFIKALGLVFRHLNVCGDCTLHHYPSQYFYYFSFIKFLFIKLYYRNVKTFRLFQYFLCFKFVHQNLSLPVCIC